MEGPRLSFDVSSILFPEGLRLGIIGGERSSLSPDINGNQLDFLTEQVVGILGEKLSSSASVSCSIVPRRCGRVGGNVISGTSSLGSDCLRNGGDGGSDDDGLPLLSVSDRLRVGGDGGSCVSSPHLCSSPYSQPAKEQISSSSSYSR